jgi:hypothetical protein
MKKLATLLLVLAISANPSMAQCKWFFMMSGGVPVSGPGATLKQKLKEDGFNSSPDSWFIFGSSGTNYPHVFHKLPFFFTIGRQVSSKGSVVFMAGRSDAGEAKGFTESAGITIPYNIFQLTTAYQLGSPGSLFKLAAGISAFHFTYGPSVPSATEGGEWKPGLSLTGRLRIGKKKKTVGMELFMQMNVASKVKTEEMSTRGLNLTAGSLNMIHGVIGLSFEISDKSAKNN